MAELLPEEMPVSEGVSSFISFDARDSNHKFVRFPGIPYPTLDEGAFLNFATIATNGGHDGNFDPTPFILPAGIESLTDFAHSAVRLSVKIGKQIASGHYGAAPHRSYHSGCSAGGRQGIAVASRYPEDFDGVITGSPAVDWNHFIGAATIWTSYVAANTSSAIPLPLWSTIITQEILRQCDELDGKVDGIITDPSQCSWNPDSLLCPQKDNGTTCLAQDQVDGLKKIYKPIIGTKGQVGVSACDPGAEGDTSLPFPMNCDSSIPTTVRRSLLN